MIIAGMRRSSPLIRTQNSEDVVPRLQKDLDVLQSRISSLTGAKPAAVPPAVSSSFVSGIRRVTEEKKYTDAESIERLPILEKVLAKITEYDREVLKKTVSNSISEETRRKSVNNDLFSLPMHLIVADRLLDLYNQSLRTDVVKVFVPVSPATESQRQSSSESECSMSSTVSTSQIVTTGLTLGEITPNPTSYALDLLDREKAINAEIQQQLQNTNEQLRAAQELINKSQQTETETKNEIITLKSALNQITLSYDEFKIDTAKRSKESVSAFNEINTELFKAQENLKENFKLNDNTQKSLDERIEIESAANQSICSALLAITADLNSIGNLYNNGNLNNNGKSSSRSSGSGSTSASESKSNGDGNNDFKILFGAFNLVSFLYDSLMSF